MLFPNGHFIFLDLETTGPGAQKDRITEIGFLEVLDGEVIDQFETLVNPRTSISSFITSLTGIDDRMVAEAPPFEQIAEDLMAKLLGKVLVAHNARFDHGFLKNEFRRAGLDYRTKVLCTVKLSRRLNPEYRSHGLDSLVERYDLDVKSRHRALSDADLLVQLMTRWSGQFGAEYLEDLISGQIRQASLPAQLDAETVEALPNTPGVYLFYDSKNTLLYVGKSVRIRERVKSHFSADHASDRELEMCRQIHRIDYQTTGGDLGAQLLEARLIKDRRPIYNRQLRKTKTLWYLQLGRDDRGYRQVEVRRANALPAGDLSDVVGLFRSRRMAEQTLREAVDSAQLCQRLSGLEKGRQGPCFAYQLHRCAGACIGEEPSASYNHRLEAALHRWRFRPWPYEGAIVIREGDDFHLVNRWCYLGTAKSPELLQDEAFPRSIDYDIYRILVKFLEKKKLTWQLHAQALAEAAT